MQTNPTPLAIALAIILSAPSLGTHAAPHALGQRSVTLEPRQGAAQRNADLPHDPMEGLWPSSASAAVAAAADAVVTVTSFAYETVTIMPTQTMAPIRLPKMQGGTMRPVSKDVPPPTITSSLPPPSSSLSSDPLTLPSTSLSNPTASTALPVKTIKILPSSSIVITPSSWSITPSSWSTIVVPIPSISIIKSAATPSSTPTPTPSISQSVEASKADIDTCPATAVAKCCTSLDDVSNTFLTFFHDIFSLLNLEQLEADAISSSPVGLSCTDLADDGVCENVLSCCTEETVPGFDSAYESCVPLI